MLYTYSPEGYHFIKPEPLDIKSSSGDRLGALPDLTLGLISLREDLIFPESNRVTQEFQRLAGIKLIIQEGMQTTLDAEMASFPVVRNFDSFPLHYKYMGSITSSISRFAANTDRSCALLDLEGNDIDTIELRRSLGEAATEVRHIYSDNLRLADYSAA